MLGSSQKSKAQIALEFLIVYSFVLIVFILIFSIISTQRAASLGQEQYSLLQLQTENIASYIDQAVSAGSGYSATIPLVSGLTLQSYNLSISSTGVIIAHTKIGSQIINAYGFSQTLNLVINGTLIQSNNGISIYQLRTTTGSLSIENSKGIIYIDQNPVSLQALPGGAVFTQVANIKSAYFGTNSFILVPSSNALTTQSSFSIGFWFEANPERESCGSLLGKSNSLQLDIYVSSPSCSPGFYPSNNILYFKYKDSSSNIHSLASSSFPAGTWINAVATFGGGTLTWYINGTNVASYSSLTGISSDSNPLYIGNGDSPFSGSIADVQIYNGVLSQKQVMMLYLNGIGGTPVGSNIIGWWPLNGNPDDYSGNGDQGIPANNPTYQNVLQLNERVISASGTNVTNTIVGFVGSAGSLGLNGSSSAFYTNSKGVRSAFITANSPLGAANVVADVFNGNLSTVGNLIGWWPLDTGYGNAVYDFSKDYDNGAFNGFSWLPNVNQTNFISASFPGNPGDVMNSNVQDGFISIRNSTSLLSIGENDTFTLVEWIYYKGDTSSHSQGLFGDWPGTGGGFQLTGDCTSCTNSVLLDVNGSYVQFPAGKHAFPSNTWEMVSAQYNGDTGLASVYLNDTLFASAYLPTGLSLFQLSPYYIGNDASQPGGLDSFNGLITNVQFYNGYLNDQQLDALYTQGITSNPIGNGGLISWWPLTDTAADYSENNNNGSLNYNVIFVNSKFSGGNFGPQTTSMAAFNGFANVVIPHTRILSVSGKFSVNFWFKSALPSSTGFAADLINTTQPSGDTLDIKLCGYGAGTGCGGITGLHGEVGSGSSWLSTSVNYPFNFVANNWYSVTENFNSTGWTIYLNGNKVANGILSGTPSLLGTNDYLELGGSSASTGFKGQLANLQIYNTTLTQQQEEQLYAEGFPIQNRINISIG